MSIVLSEFDENTLKHRVLGYQTHPFGIIDRQPKALASRQLEQESRRVWFEWLQSPNNEVSYLVDVESTHSGSNIALRAQKVGPACKMGRSNFMRHRMEKGSFEAINAMASDSGLIVLHGNLKQEGEDPTQHLLAFKPRSAAVAEYGISLGEKLLPSQTWLTHASSGSLLITGLYETAGQEGSSGFFATEFDAKTGTPKLEGVYPFPPDFLKLFPGNRQTYFFG